MTDTEHEAMKMWLKCHFEPQSQVVEYTRKTAIPRAQWVRENPGLAVTTIQSEYPRLFDMPGLVSILQTLHCLLYCR